MNTQSQFSSHSQPMFVENIVESVRQLVEATRERQLYVYRPDYSKPVGLNNLFRTVMHLDEQPAPGQLMHVVQISNLDLHDTWTVLYSAADIYAAEQGSLPAIKTWHHQPAVKMMTKEHLVSNLGYRNQNDCHVDIANYLLYGTLPEQVQM